MTARPPASPTGSAPRIWSLRLIDRRTGRPHRCGDAILTVLARDPRIAAAEMLEGRSLRDWHVEMQPL
ncbi:hypothetical protein [Mangrovicoccus algicola]|uniref:Uncharacterized protein n=1 Tax=Mangrovicoccus algicola TaxID=2771008 RepID=A0A8J7CZR7_9RHOB|nr:hypothetical protein [Mangrovicoccus algicola]MBE3638323.1 hypothetical protein [Mangrovicoccus algicola]